MPHDAPPLRPRSTPPRGPAHALAVVVRRIDARRRHGHARPMDRAIDFKVLARGVLLGVADARRSAFAPHLVKASSRRHLAYSLQLAGLYRRRAAEALAQRPRTAA